MGNVNLHGHYQLDGRLNKLDRFQSEPELKRQRPDPPGRSWLQCEGLGRRWGHAVAGNMKQVGNRVVDRDEALKMAR